MCAYISIDFWKLATFKLLFPWQNANTATFFHTTEGFFSIHHISADFIHILFDSLQLLCLAKLLHINEKKITKSYWIIDDNHMEIQYKPNFMYICRLFIQTINIGPLKQYTQTYYINWYLPSKSDHSYFFLLIKRRSKSAFDLVADFIFLFSFLLLNIHTANIGI